MIKGKTHKTKIINKFCNYYIITTINKFYKHLIIKNIMEQNLVENLRKSIREYNIYKKDFIYLIGRDKIAKSKWSAKEEFVWGKYLKRNEIRVPEMYAIIRPDSQIERKIHEEDTIEDWTVIMEKIAGQEIRNTSGAKRKEAIKQYKKKLKKF